MQALWGSRQKPVEEPAYPLWVAGVSLLVLGMGVIGGGRRDGFGGLLPQAAMPAVTEVELFADAGAANAGSVGPADQGVEAADLAVEPMARQDFLREIPEVLETFQPAPLAPLLEERPVAPTAASRIDEPVPADAQAAPAAVAPVGKHTAAKSKVRRASRTAGEVAASGASGSGGGEARGSASGTGPAGAPEVFRGGTRGKFPAPGYPAAALSARLQGEVQLLVTVESNGLPGAVSVLRSCGHAVLDKAARDQVQRRWRWEDGASRRYIVPIRFVLQ